MQTASTPSGVRMYNAKAEYQSSNTGARREWSCGGDLTILLQMASAGMQQSVSSQGWLPWVPVAALIVSLITLATILIFRWRDNRTRLIISYSVGQPENPTDIVSIPEDERPREPALYIKIFNGSKMSVGLNN